MIEFPNLFDGVTLPVRQIAFTPFGIEVYWYGIFITLSVVLGIIYATKNARRVGLTPDDVFETAFWGVLGGVAGARMYYVVFYNLDPANADHKYTLSRAIFGMRDGGIAIYGAVIGAVLAAYVVTKLRKIKFAPLADLVGLGFLIGHAIGRWGNFTNQEAFGAATAHNLPWGMTGDIIAQSDVVREAARQLNYSTYALVHPCFLYESLWCAIGFVVLHMYMKKKRSFDGEIFLLYAAWYGTGRAFIEPLRIDSLMLGPVRVSMLLAIVTAVAAIATWAYLKKSRATNKVVMLVNTDIAKERYEKYKLNSVLEKEKERAKSQLRETTLVLNEAADDAVAAAVQDDDDDDEHDEFADNEYEREPDSK